MNRKYLCFSGCSETFGFSIFTVFPCFYRDLQFQMVVCSISQKVCGELGNNVHVSMHLFPSFSLSHTHTRVSAWCGGLLHINMHLLLFVRSFLARIGRTPTLWSLSIFSCRDTWLHMSLFYLEMLVRSTIWYACWKTHRTKVKHGKACCF